MSLPEYEIYAIKYGERMGTYYRGFVNEEARALGFTLDDLRAWTPAAGAAKRGRKPKS